MSTTNKTSQVWVPPDWTPKNITDDTIVPVIINDVIPDPEKQSSEPEGKAEKLLHQLKVGSTSTSKSETNDNTVITKVVFMPDGDSKKWYAKDDEGKYVGLEPYRQWSEKELDERWGGNRLGLGKGPNRGAFDQLGNAGYGGF